MKQRISTLHWLGLANDLVVEVNVVIDQESRDRVKAMEQGRVNSAMVAVSHQSLPPLLRLRLRN